MACTAPQTPLSRAPYPSPGELNGRDPLDSVRCVFVLLSRPDGSPGSDGLITLAKLRAACADLEVPPTPVTSRCKPPMPPILPLRKNCPAIQSVVPGRLKCIAT